jgi:hypothetical protein
MAEDSAIVFVAPEDSIDSVVRKIRATSGRSVELLVPDGTPALQTLSGFLRLREALERDLVSVLVISSDEKTLNAARLSQFETVGVAGARVGPPPADDLSGRVGVRPPGGRPTVPFDDQDAEFLDALDQMEPADSYATADDDQPMALDDLSDAVAPASAGRLAHDDDEFAAAFDALSPLDDRRRPPADDWDIAPSRASTGSQRRARSADLAVAPGRDSRATRELTRTGALARRDGRDSRQALDDELAEDLAPRRSIWGAAIPLLILLIVAAGGLLWYLRSRVTIVVTPPRASVSQRNFTDEVIPLAGGADKSQGAVQAAPVGAPAEFTVQGQVISETLSPAGRAKGVVTIYNTVSQNIELPQGTEFIAITERGGEARFTLDAPATVPGALSTSSVSGSSVTNGKIDVAVTARSPGSASNVGENAIKQLAIPGQQPITTDTSNFLIRHAPIGGGSEELLRIITEDDVRRALPAALTGLYAAGRDALQNQINAQQEIDPISIHPTADEIAQPESYEIVVEPAVGAQVDPNNPNFNVTVRTRFSGLAAPRGQLVGDQIKAALLQHFSAPCKSGERASVDLSDYRWDGQRLTVDGTITCMPSAGLAPETINRVKLALIGKPRAEAERNLRVLQQDGLIGEYTLPNRDPLPSLDFLLTVVEGQPAPQPTSLP